MVMVVAHPILEPGRRSGGLNTPDETFGGQDAEGVVDGLDRDGANLRADDLDHAVGRDVRLTRDGPQDSQSLRGDLNTTLPKKISWVVAHDGSLAHFLE
jgi:hypothetical protein